MPGNFELASKKFLEYRVQLYSQFPDAKKDARALGANIVNPHTASADQMWDVLWNKPLYANARSDSVKKKVEALKKPLSGAWKSMAEEDGPFKIDRVGPGFAVNSFSVIGTSAKKIIGFRVAPHRLYAIVGAGRELSIRAEQSATPFADLTFKDLPSILGLLKEKFGFGWGFTTILHFLTDLGLACKTDIHLVRTVRALGIWAGEEDQLNIREAIEVNQIVNALAQKIYRDVTPPRFRELDKNLMDISRRLFKKPFR